MVSLIDMDKALKGTFYQRVSVAAMIVAARLDDPALTYDEVGTGAKRVKQLVQGNNTVVQNQIALEILNSESMGELSATDDGDIAVPDSDLIALVEGILTKP